MGMAYNGLSKPLFFVSRIPLKTTPGKGFRYAAKAALGVTIFFGQFTECAVFLCIFVVRAYCSPFMKTCNDVLEP